MGAQDGAAPDVVPATPVPERGVPPPITVNYENQTLTVKFEARSNGLVHWSIGATKEVTPKHSGKALLIATDKNDLRALYGADRLTAAALAHALLRAFVEHVEDVLRPIRVE